MVVELLCENCLIHVIYFNNYFLLQTTQNKSGSFLFDIHFWIGRDTSQVFFLILYPALPLLALQNFFFQIMANVQQYCVSSLQVCVDHSIKILRSHMRNLGITDCLLTVFFYQHLSNLESYSPIFVGNWKIHYTTAWI